MDSKSPTYNLEPDEIRSDLNATSLRPIAKSEHESNAAQAETPATRMPKATWAWAESSRHFDWMDWHTPSALAGVTDFDL
jgi:hypothetical protein